MTVVSTVGTRFTMATHSQAKKKKWLAPGFFIPSPTGYLGFLANSLCPRFRSRRLYFSVSSNSLLPHLYLCEQFPGDLSPFCPKSHFPFAGRELLCGSFLFLFTTVCNSFYRISAEPIRGFGYLIPVPEKLLLDK